MVSHLSFIANKKDAIFLSVENVQDGKKTGCAGGGSSSTGQNGVRGRGTADHKNWRKDLRGLGQVASVDAALVYDINPMRDITGLCLVFLVS